MTQVKLSDVLMETTKAVQALGAKAGINLKTTEIYNNDQVEALAVVGGLVKQLLEKASKETIEVINK